MEPFICSDFACATRGRVCCRRIKDTCLRYIVHIYKSLRSSPPLPCFLVASPRISATQDLLRGFCTWERGLINSELQRNEIATYSLNDRNCSGPRNCNETSSICKSRRNNCRNIIVADFRSVPSCNLFNRRIGVDFSNLSRLKRA